MKNSSVALTTCFSGLLVGLVGCGGAGQDSAEKNLTANKEITFSGVAIDGHVARSMVFLDTNNNATRDPWEAFAFTDNDGYYSYNPTTNINYCASSASAEQVQYCLRTTQTTTSVVVRIDGGYDVLTGEPFEGQLSRRVDVVNGQAPFSVVSPITTLLVSANTAAESKAILDSLALTSADLDIDYVNSTDIVHARLLNTALTLHKTVSILADRLTDTYPKIGDDFGTPNDASAIVYQQFAETIITQPQIVPLQQIISPFYLNSIWVASELSVRDIYVHNEMILPSFAPSAHIIATASKIPSVVNSLIPAEQSNQTQADVVGSVKALESVVIKTLQETAPDHTIDTAINFFTNSSNQPLIESLTTSLAGKDSDLPALIKHNFTTGMDSTESIANVVKIAESIKPFSALGGFKVKVSDMDLGSTPNNLKDKEVEFYFQGDSTALSGAFLACVKYIDGANVDGSLGDGNARGELVKGYWSLLGASEANLASYNILLTIEFLGAKYSATIKPAESVVVAGATIKQFRFDNSGEFIIWRSPEGLRPIDSLPTSSKECEQRLPSRIGLSN